MIWALWFVGTVVVLYGVLWLAPLIPAILVAMVVRFIPLPPQLMTVICTILTTIAVTVFTFEFWQKQEINPFWPVVAALIVWFFVTASNPKCNQAARTICFSIISGLIVCGGALLFR